MCVLYQIIFPLRPFSLDYKDLNMLETLVGSFGVLRAELCGLKLSASLGCCILYRCLERGTLGGLGREISSMDDEYRYKY